MKRNIIRTCVVGLGLLTLASCEDPMDELTSLLYDRVFSPIDFEARNITENSVNLQWVKSDGADSYTIEIFADDSLTYEFKGEPVQTITGITADQIPYTVSNLVYDTKYSAYIMAVDADDAERNSKWHGVYFHTSAQQIFNSIPESSISDRSVTVTWPGGEEVTRITATETNTGVIAVDKELTDEEKAEGKAVITGLTPETSYTIKLYNNDKERGSKSIKTITDLDGATTVSPDEDFASLLESATDGQVFALYGGTYTIASESGAPGNAKITKNITIKGIYPTNLPVIKGRFQLDDGASLSLNQVILDGGENETTDQAFNYKTSGATYDHLDVQNCEIRNFGKGLLYLNVASTINKVTFNNCLIHNITCDGGDFLDSRTGRINELNLTNSTIYSSAAARDFIRMDDASGSMGGGTPVINVKNCTIDGAANASSKRLLYVRYVGNVINWENNLVTNTDAMFSNQSKTSVPTFKGNVYFNTPNLEKAVEGGNLFTDESGTWNVDPKYKDAANGDFTVTNEDVSTKGAGDPRWLK